MIDVPHEVEIKASIKFGSVYYFPEDSFLSSEPHYFVVINKNPFEDKVLFLVCASSKIDNVKKRRTMCPTETVVKITPAQYSEFTVTSVIDCNHVFEKTTDQLIDKLVNKKLRLKTEMDTELVEQLRQGVLASPLVEYRIKALLQD